MSKFSGKCDFYDGFVMINSDDDEEKVNENLKKTDLYIWGSDNRRHRIKADTVKDIVKYYPYLESMAFYSGDKYSITLSNDSFIDQEERERLSSRIKDVLAYWRKCKRNKAPFDVEECCKAVWGFGNDEITKEIATRVAEYGDKAEFKDIHLPMHEYYRKNWFDEMVKTGYTEFEAYTWCFNAMWDKEETIIKRLGRPLKKEGFDVRR